MSRLVAIIWDTLRLSFSHKFRFALRAQKELTVLPLNTPVSNLLRVGNLLPVVERKKRTSWCGQVGKGATIALDLVQRGESHDGPTVCTRAELGLNDQPVKKPEPETQMRKVQPPHVESMPLRVHTPNLPSDPASLRLRLLRLSDFCFLPGRLHILLFCWVRLRQQYPSYLLPP